MRDAVPLPLPHPRRATTWISLSLFSFFPPFSSSILLRHSFSSEKLLASCPRPRLFRLAFFRRAAQLRVETGKRESLRTRKPRYLGLKSILTLRCAISTRGLVVPCSLIPRLVLVSLSLFHRFLVETFNRDRRRRTFQISHIPQL